MSTPGFSLLSQSREMAKAANQLAWALLEQQDRTESETQEMMHAAHASYYLWGKVDQGAPLQRGARLLSRAYLMAGQHPLALAYARQCLARTETDPGPLADFDFFYAQEGMARALAAVGEVEQARHYLARAREWATKIADDEDRAIVEGDLTAEPWFGLRLESK